MVDISNTLIKKNIRAVRIQLLRLCVYRKTCIKNNNKIEDIIVVDTSANEIKILTNLIIEIVKSNTETESKTIA